MKTLSAMSDYVMSIYAKFHPNPSTKYGDIAPCGTGMGTGWTRARTARWTTRNHLCLLLLAEA